MDGNGLVHHSVANALCRKSMEIQLVAFVRSLIGPT